MTTTVRSILPALLVTLGACASRPATAPTPTTTPAPATRTAPLTEAPRNWMLLDPTADHVYGISLLRAERELLANRKPQRTVVVAVIDNGIDTAHATLRPHLWVNPKEIPGNGKDDDGDGFVDDVRGWDFIAGADGKYVDHDTYELTRVAGACADSAKRAKLPADYQARCSTIAAEFLRKRQELEQTMNNIRQISSLYTQILPYLRRASHAESVTVAGVTAINPAGSDTLARAKDVFLRLSAQGITPAVVAEAKTAYEGQLEYGYNTSFDPRATIVRDDYPDTMINRYGNPDVKGPGGMHGTHVSGIIAANRPIGMARATADSTDCCGIASAVKIMAIRTVPDGDERDKDVANAIRFAADHGAQVINMSFGKAYSPYKNLVDAAVKYADAKGVLMVHAAGNEGANSEQEPSFPTPVYLDGGRAQNWIEVGASSWKSGNALVASFSNYGKPVDIFAPGEDITSTVPGGKYEQESGTSMASPVVAGVAALIMSYYPTLTASDVKKVILESATKVPGVSVTRPGSTAEHVQFSELSTTGGIVNAYAALQAADRMAAAHP